MRSEIRRALCYFTLVAGCKGDERKACKLFDYRRADQLFSLYLDRYAAGCGIPASTLQAIHHKLRTEYESIGDDVRVLFSGCPEWPSQLKGRQAPRVLFLQGNTSLLSRFPVCIIGSRAPSVEAKKETVQAVRTLAGKGFLPVSSLSLGTSGLVQAASLHYNLPSLGVLETPLNRFYPEAHKKIQSAVGQRNLLLSGFPYGVVQKRWFAVIRNRLMINLSKAVVAMEDRDGSSTAVQARYAVEQGIPLFIPRRVYDNCALLWPRELKQGGEVHVIRSMGEIPRLLREAEERDSQEAQLSLF